MTTEASPTPPAYPATLIIDYPDRPLNRLTTFFRIFTVIPIAIILVLVSGANFDWSRMHGWDWQYAAGGILFLATLLMILFRQKYPRWWFDWNIALTKFGTRVATYIGLLTDVYPSTDEEQAVHIEIPYPDVPKDLNRWLPLVKWFLAIPHYIILAFLVIAAFVCVVIAWFAILFTSRYPRGLFDFVVGVSRWSLRVAAYAFLLTTDRYPLFSLD
jgi:small-conductance mechanosensitive channel